jgi:hypothetical protein
MDGAARRHDGGDDDLRAPLLSPLERQASAGPGASGNARAAAAAAAATDGDVDSTAPMFDPMEYPYLDETVLNELRDIQAEFDIEAGGGGGAPEELPHADEDVFKVQGLGGGVGWGGVGWGGVGWGGVGWGGVGWGWVGVGWGGGCSRRGSEGKP